MVTGPPAIRRLRFVPLAAAVLAAACSRDGSDPLQIRLAPSDRDSASSCIEVVGLSSIELTALRQHPPSADEWPALLRVSNAADAGGGAGSTLPPIAGRYDVTDRALVFTPMFGLDAGRRYSVTFTPARAPQGARPALSRREPLTLVVARPKADVAPSTVVDRVYPTVDVVPENQLRLYVHFSAPMGLRAGSTTSTFSIRAAAR